MEVPARAERALKPAARVESSVLAVRSALKAGIMLLDAVPVHRVLQIEREIRVQVEQGAGDETVQPESVLRMVEFVIHRGRSGLDPASIGRIDIAERIELPAATSSSGICPEE